MNEVENDDIEIIINLNEDNHDDVLTDDNKTISSDKLANLLFSMPVNIFSKELIKVINLNEDNHDDVLNVPISQTEIENFILNLHNDKSSGLDNVTNEYSELRMLQVILS
jgi:hypothetical protein